MPRLRGMRLIPGSERAGSPFPVLSCTTWGLPCRLGCPRRGGLLPHPFNLTCDLAAHRRYPFCCTFRPGPSRFPSLTFARRVALWCPDFPQAVLAHNQRPSGERQRGRWPQWTWIPRKRCPIFNTAPAANTGHRPGRRGGIFRAVGPGLDRAGRRVDPCACALGRCGRRRRRSGAPFCRGSRRLRG